MASVLVRTDYSDEPAWQSAVAAATAAYDEEEFQADFIIIEDPDWSGANESVVRQQAVADGFKIPEIFVVDEHALATPHEVLVIGLREGQESFRCPAHQLSSVQNNLALANLDFEELAGHAGPDGVYRG